MKNARGEKGGQSVVRDERKEARGNNGGKLNHLAKWSKIIKRQRDGGLGLSDLNKKYGSIIKMGVEIHVRIEGFVVQSS